MITKSELVSQLRELGLKEGMICNVKVSLKSIGKIDGGAETVIDAILDVIGKDGTLVCDSFNSCFSSYFRLFNRSKVVDRNTKSYAGAFVNAVIKHPLSYRSKHPIQAFSAIGKYAEKLTHNFNENSKPYEFLERISDMGAVNLRIGNKVIGVGTTHVAICNLGFQQKYLPMGIYYRNEQGKLKYFDHSWASGCNVGFNKLSKYYESGNAIIGKGKIGDAEAVLSSMKKTLEIEIDLFKKDPTAFFCKDPGCVSCSFNWKHSEFSLTRCVLENVKRRDFKRALFAIVESLFGTWHK